MSHSEIVSLSVAIVIALAGSLALCFVMEPSIERTVLSVSFGLVCGGAAAAFAE